MKDAITEALALLLIALVVLIVKAAPFIVAGLVIFFILRAMGFA